MAENEPSNPVGLSPEANRRLVKEVEGGRNIHDEMVERMSEGERNEKSSDEENKASTAEETSSHEENKKPTAEETSSHEENKASTAGETSSHAENKKSTAKKTSRYEENKKSTAKKTSRYEENKKSTAKKTSSHEENKKSTAKKTSRYEENKKSTAKKTSRYEENKESISEETSGLTDYLSSHDEESELSEISSLLVKTAKRLKKMQDETVRDMDEEERDEKSSNKENKSSPVAGTSGMKYKPPPLPDALCDHPTDESAKETSPETSPDEESPPKSEKKSSEEVSAEKCAHERSSPFGGNSRRESPKEIISETILPIKDVSTKNLPLSEINQNEKSAKAEKMRVREKLKRYPKKAFRRRYVPAESDDPEEASAVRAGGSENQRGHVKNKNDTNRVSRKRMSKFKESSAENICTSEEDPVPGTSLNSMSLDDESEDLRNPASSEEVFVQDFIEVEVTIESSVDKELGCQKKEGTTTKFCRGRKVSERSDGEKRVKKAEDSTSDESSSDTKSKRAKRDEVDESEIE